MTKEEVAIELVLIALENGIIQFFPETSEITEGFTEEQYSQWSAERLKIITQHYKTVFENL